jgi:pimeloyl-ACP methyl ester carboxylesterase
VTVAPAPRDLRDRHRGERWVGQVAPAAGTPGLAHEGPERRPLGGEQPVDLAHRHVARRSDRGSLWAERDPALKLRRYGEQAPAAAGISRIETIAAKHFPQEDQAAAMAQHVSDFIRKTDKLL